MSWVTVLDVLASIFFLLGCVLALVAAIGLVRFPDLLSRMHAATKPQVLGLILMVLGLAIHLRDPLGAGPLVLLLTFQMITAPVSAHMVGRAGYRTGRIRQDLLVRDELTLDLEAARRHAEERAPDRDAGADEPPPTAPR